MVNPSRLPVRNPASFQTVDATRTSAGMRVAEGPSNYFLISLETFVACVEEIRERVFTNENRYFYLLGYRYQRPKRIRATLAAVGINRITGEWSSSRLQIGAIRRTDFDFC